MAHQRFDGIIGYFEPTILATYRAEPDKYSVQTDFFEGRVGITTPYYESLPEAERDEAYSRGPVRLQNLGERRTGACRVSSGSPRQVGGPRQQVEGVPCSRPLWSDYEQDERFKNWIRRYPRGIGTSTTDRLITSLRKSS